MKQYVLLLALVGLAHADLMQNQEATYALDEATALTQADPVEAVPVIPTNMSLYGFLAAVVTLTMLISYFAPDLTKSPIYDIKAKESLKSLYKLLFGGMIIMFIIAVYRHFAEDKWINAITLGYAGYIVGILVFSLYQFGVMCCYERRYKIMEANCHSQMGLRQVQDTFKKEKLDRQNYTKLKSYKAYSYAVMRDLFIHPSYMPKFNENFLPHYFDFSLYLMMALDKTFSRILTMDISTFFVLLAFVSVWPLLLNLSVNLQFFIMSGFPLLFAISSWVIYSCCSRIIVKLNPDLNKATMINLQYEEIDIPTHLANIQIPIYYDKYTNNPYLNSHEALFCCGSFGKNLIKSVLQGVFFFSVLWVVLFCFYHLPSVDYKWYHIIIFIVSLLVFLFYMLFLVNKCIGSYSLATSIQMMKKNDLIFKTIASMEKNSVDHQLRIYKVIKLIYIEEKLESMKLEPSDLPSCIQDKIESDLAAIALNYETISVTRLHQLIQLSGQEATKLEKLLFLRKCKCDGETIDRNIVIDAIRINLKVDSMKPYDVIKESLSNISAEDEFQDSEGRAIDLRIMENFFKKYATYFDEEDYKYNQQLILELAERDSIKISDYANKIASSVSNYPK